MEVDYSIGVSNRFAFLMAEEDDPGDLIMAPTSPSEKVDKDKKKKDAKGNKKTKETRDKGQQVRKSVQDTTKQGDDKSPPTRPRSGRQDNRNQSGEEREYYPRGEGGRGRGEGGRGRGRGEGRGRGGRPRLSSRDKENEGGGFPSGGDRGFSGGGDRGFSGGGDRGFSGGGDRGFSGGGDRGFGGGERNFGGDREDRGEGRGGGRGMGRFRGGRGGGPGGGGGGGGGRGGFRGKREFERRSGSDKSSIKAVEKREGGGAHNWGKKEDVDDWPEEGEETQPPPSSTAMEPQEPAPNAETGTADKTEEETGEVVEEVKEEEPQEMTLDEYKALLSKSSKETIKREAGVRKPGENVDNSQWKDAVLYERTEGEYFPGTREVIEKPKTSGRIKQTLNSHFYFKDPARRGGRGRSFGGRSRGESRGDGRRYKGDRRDNRAPNVEDKFDFPKLQTTVSEEQ